MVDGIGTLMTVTIAMVVILVYFLPALLGRHKPDATAIATINLILGWTLIGWIVALVMATREFGSDGRPVELPLGAKLLVVATVSAVIAALVWYSADPDAIDDQLHGVLFRSAPAGNQPSR